MVAVGAEAFRRFGYWISVSVAAKTKVEINKKRKVRHTFNLFSIKDFIFRIFPLGISKMNEPYG